MHDRAPCIVRAAHNTNNVTPTVVRVLNEFSCSNSESEPHFPALGQIAQEKRFRGDNEIDYTIDQKSALKCKVKAVNDESESASAGF